MVQSHSHCLLEGVQHNDCNEWVSNWESNGSSNGEEPRGVGETCLQGSGRDVSVTETCQASLPTPVEIKFSLVHRKNEENKKTMNYILQQLYPLSLKGCPLLRALTIPIFGVFNFSFFQKLLRGQMAVVDFHLF